MKEQKLLPPCTYQGGKQRISNHIVDYIFKDFKPTEDTKFYDLCCGSGSISIELINRGISPCNITMVDKSLWGEFYSKIGSGEFSLDLFEGYIDNIPIDKTRIKNHIKEIINNTLNSIVMGDYIYYFLIIQASMFGGASVWIENGNWKLGGGLRDYWLPTETSKRKSPVNPMMPMPNELLNRVGHICTYMEGVNGVCGDVSEFYDIEDNSIVYIDPPYKNTHKYGYDLDYDTYINNLLELNKNIKIYVSESYPMPLAKETILISSGRKKGNMNGNIKKGLNEEWLNIFY